MLRSKVNTRVNHRPTLTAGKLDVLDYLVNELEVDPVARDKAGMSSVHAATQGGQTNTVKVCVL